MKKIIFLLVLSIMAVWSCTTEQDTETGTIVDDTKQILSLGDSYTIGQSVCDTCRFPEQLRSALSNVTEFTIDINIIAQTGWTTTDLISSINNQSPSSDYDLVTLLIGVNNQYQNKPFTLYEEEFPQLVDMAAVTVNGNRDKVVVISIPDYAFTPFGQNLDNSETISQEINMYNMFAESYCNDNNITFINITDITREGLDNPGLVASDGLHPSELAYSLFVERLLPEAVLKIE